MPGSLARRQRRADRRGAIKAIQRQFDLTYEEAEAQFQQFADATARRVMVQQALTLMKSGAISEEEARDAARYALGLDKEEA